MVNRLRGFRLVCEGDFRLGDEFFDSGWIVDRHVGEYLAVEFDFEVFQSFDEAIVGEALGTDSGADPGDPEGAEIPLPRFAVTSRHAVLVNQGIQYCP